MRIKRKKRKVYKVRKKKEVEIPNYHISLYLRIVGSSPTNKVQNTKWFSGSSGVEVSSPERKRLRPGEPFGRTVISYQTQLDMFDTTQFMSPRP